MRKKSGLRPLFDSSDQIQAIIYVSMSAKIFKKSSIVIDNDKCLQMFVWRKHFSGKMIQLGFKFANKIKETAK